MSYLELMISCGLSPDRHCGWFDYHLKVLLDEGIIKKEDDQYLLTDFGRNVARLMNTIEGESQRLFQKEVNTLEKEVVTIQEKAPSITIEEVPDRELMINLDHRQPLWWQGERRIYRESASVPHEIEDPWGRNNYLMHTCLERTWFPKKEEYHYVRLKEVYASKYDGTEENRRIVQRTEEGYYLDNWTKIWEIQKKDGLYQTKFVNWCIRGPTEPEEYPPEKLLSFPATLKTGQKGREGPIHFPKEPEEITSTKEWEITGDYKIRISRDSYECILKRELITFMYNGKMYPNIPRFVKDSYYAKGLLKVLSRRWDRPVFMRKLGYKNWENSPKLEYKGDTYYLTSDDYLAERYIPIVNLSKIKDS